MGSYSSNNKRIAKNTLLLYVRMLFVMAASLFTSRVVLNALGVEDFGIYNVVGGFITMFTMLSGSFSTAISRFITYELGKNDASKLNSIFCTSVNIQLLMSVVVVVAAEIIGIWFLNTKMNIPIERMSAANWVLQCSIGVFVLNLLNIPFHAEIIAHEHMGAYAVVSMIDVSLKLLVGYMLLITPFDLLKAYAVFLLAEAVIMRIVYMAYCAKHFDECSYRFCFDKKIFGEMGRFAGWNFFGASAGILNTHGVNMLMNIYFGVAVNAARGLASQVDAAVRSFTSSFTTAVNPQITKSYSAGDVDYTNQLICRGAKFSVFLFLYMAVPIVFETQTLLSIWLKIVPDYTVTFVRLLVLGTFVDSVLGNSFWTGIMATGNIKAYQIVIAIVGVSVFPISWIFFKLGFGPASTYIVYFVVYCVAFCVRLYFANKQLNLPLKYFFKYVMIRIVPVVILCFLLPIPLVMNVNEGFIRLVVTCLVSFILSSFVIYFVGLDGNERGRVKSMISSKIQGIRK